MADPELRSALDRLVVRVGDTLRGCGDAYPYAADPVTGKWFTTPDGDWCGGLWVSMLWMAHDLTGEARFREAAIAQTAPLRAKLDQDDMFRSLTFYYAGARAWEIAGLPWQRDLALKGARAVLGMYDERTRQIPIGSEVQVLGIRKPHRGGAISAVDNIYVCLLLPWWAWRETGEERFREICIAHADRAIELFIRPDHSTLEFVEFDLDTGEPLRRFTGLGCADDSCWSRGQAWCIAGLVRAWEHTGERRYLEAAGATTRYFIDHASADHVPFYDFTDPGIPDVERDSSAAAITSAALLRLLPLVDRDPHARALAETGHRIARSLVRGYLTPLGSEDPRPQGMLLRGCFNRPRPIFPDAELLWGDHYLMEGLYMLHRAGVL